MQLYLAKYDKGITAEAINKLCLQIEFWVKENTKINNPPCSQNNKFKGRIFLDFYTKGRLSQQIHPMLSNYEWCTQQKAYTKDQDGHLINLTDLGVAQVIFVEKMRELGFDVWGATPMGIATKGWAKHSTLCLPEHADAKEDGCDNECLTAAIAEVIRQSAGTGNNILVANTNVITSLPAYIPAPYSEMIPPGCGQRCDTPPSCCEQAFMDLMLPALGSFGKDCKTLYIEHLGRKTEFKLPTTATPNKDDWKKAWVAAFGEEFTPNKHNIETLCRIAHCCKKEGDQGQCDTTCHW